ncbi:MAG: hypothetical protein V1748_06145 [Actinomycetota bacterium]
MNTEADESLGGFLDDVMGYSEEEKRAFLSDPRNTDVLAKMAGLAGKTIVVELVQAKGCYLGYRAGDKLYFDGGGNLISSMAPKRVCPFAITALTPMLFAVQELAYAGADPGELRFKRAGCPDVGPTCGGWGHVVMELRVEDRA